MFAHVLHGSMTVSTCAAGLRALSASVGSLPSIVARVCCCNRRTSLRLSAYSSQARSLMSRSRTAGSAEGEALRRSRQSGESTSCVKQGEKSGICSLSLSAEQRNRTAVDVHLVHDGEVDPLPPIVMGDPRARYPVESEQPGMADGQSRKGRVVCPGPTSG